MTGHRLEDFIKIEKIGEGTYGIVFKVKRYLLLLNILDLTFATQGKNKKTGEIVAMKKIRLESEDEGVSYHSSTFCHGFSVAFQLSLNC